MATGQPLDHPHRFHEAGARATIPERNEFFPWLLVDYFGNLGASRLRVLLRHGVEKISPALPAQLFVLQKSTNFTLFGAGDGMIP